MTSEYRAIAIDEETFELLTQVTIGYDRDSVAEAVEKSTNVASEKYESEPAQILTELLNN